MAFTDPQTITIDTVESTLNKIQSVGYSSEYATPDENLKLKISHQDSKKKTRRLVRLDVRKIAADPLTAVNEYKDSGIYFVIEDPEFGFTSEELEDYITGFIAWFTSANIQKLLANQH